MRRFLKWLGIGLGSLIGFILIVTLGLYASTSVRLNRVYSVQEGAITIPTDTASIERGRLWVTSECTHCHGSDLSGTTIFDDPKLGKIDAPNLTSGKGGAGNEFTDADWVRAIRYGINPEGHSLFIMPSSDFYHFSDADLGEIIAYLKSLTPVNKEWADPLLTPMAYVLISAGAFGELIQAENIPHNAARLAVPQPGVSIDYGRYLVTVSGCRTCHGVNLAGGHDPNPAAPPAPGLTSSGGLAKWAPTDFIATIRNGVDISGHHLTDFMPWRDFMHMSDKQLTAIWLYLQSPQSASGK
ncbi:MAG TPA: c-type cytochrome [Anaerolineaceae bacterium]|nr:c-type cytochrome [Anaerolineaceae bacterium]